MVLEMMSSVKCTLGIRGVLFLKMKASGGSFSRSSNDALGVHPRDAACPTDTRVVRVVETLLMLFIQIFPDAWEIGKGRSVQAAIRSEVRGYPYSSASS